ncbi:MAG: SPASM domain-containing protein [Candidatus Edwardsbacteria bacterium]|nr:SPASM domain-containing protein [Candidatus Edwardsbacteria bacterium]
MADSYKVSRFNIWHKGTGRTFLYNTFTTGLMALNEAGCEKVRTALSQPEKIGALDHSEIEVLLKNGFIVSSELEELDMVKFRYRRGVFSEKNFSLILVPTTKCNFICSYCFEQNKRHEEMSPGDQEQILTFLEEELKSIRPESFMVGWYGGEPLFCPQVIESMSGRIGRICASLGIKRQADWIVTNGYFLDQDMAQLLRRCNIDDVQISLDGNREYHDKSRILCDGSGTFDRLLDSIGTAQRHFAKVNVRINTNRQNLEGVRRMVTDLEIFKADNVRWTIGNLKHYLGGQIGKDQDDGYFKGPELQGVQREMGRYKPVRPGAASPGPREQFFHTKMNNCGGDSFKCFFIGPGAMVYKCAEHMEPEDAAGVIENGKFVPHPRYYDWVMDEPFDSPACLKCSYLPMCMGGCPAIRKRVGVPNDETCGYWRQWLKYKFEDLDACPE